MTPSQTTPGTDWSRLHAAVLADQTLHARLLAAPDAAAFHHAALALAGELGIPLARSEIEAATTNARRAWITRRVSP